jgi:tetratricopeptide (TPR) repeat protein
MLSIYIVSSWLILQVLAVIAEPLGLPQKSVTYLILILLIGFPIYIYYIWKFRLLKYEIQQTEDPNTPYNKSAFQKMYFSSLFVVGLLSGIAIAFIINNNFGSNFSLDEIRGNDRIAVLKFENNTDDSNLDRIGKITADWIVHGITKNEVAQVISPKVVDDYTGIIKSQAGALDIKNLLQNYFKPGKVITGAFYKEKNQLLLHCSIMDGLLDKTLISFETIVCNPNSPLDCGEALKEKILGYLSIEGDDNFFEKTPPTFEAYQYNQIAHDNLDNDALHMEFLDKAIETDPNFFTPKTHKLAFYYNKGQYKIADSLRLLMDNKSSLTPRQENIMLFYESILKGKNDKAYRAHKEELKKTYLDLSTNMSNMTIALQLVNRPEDIDEIFKQIPMDDVILENCQRCGFRYYLKGLADVELGNYNDVISTLVPITNIIEHNYLKRPLISAYVKSGKFMELENYLSDYNLTANIVDIDYLSVFTGIQLINANHIEEANKYFNKIITRKNSPANKLHLAQSYYYKGDYINAENLYKELHEIEVDNVENLVQLAICYFNNGKFSLAKTSIEKLDSLRTEYQFGAVDYGWAQYYSAIGDKSKTIEFLLKAVSQGYNFTPSTFQNDPHFRTIIDSPEFNNRIMNYWKNKSI